MLDVSHGLSSQCVEKVPHSSRSPTHLTTFASPTRPNPIRLHYFLLHPTPLNPTRPTSSEPYWPDATLSRPTSPNLSRLTSPNPTRPDPILSRSNYTTPHYTPDSIRAYSTHTPIDNTNCIRPNPSQPLHSLPHVITSYRVRRRPLTLTYPYTISPMCRNLAIVGIWYDGHWCRATQTVFRWRDGSRHHDSQKHQTEFRHNAVNHVTVSSLWAKNAIWLTEWCDCNSAYQSSKFMTYDSTFKTTRVLTIVWNTGGKQSE